EGETLAQTKRRQRKRPRFTTSSAHEGCVQIPDPARALLPTAFPIGPPASWRWEDPPHNAPNYAGDRRSCLPAKECAECSQSFAWARRAASPKPHTCQPRRKPVPATITGERGDKDQMTCRVEASPRNGAQGQAKRALQGPTSAPQTMRARQL